MRKSSPRLKTSRQLRGQALVNLKEDLADHIATGSPTRLEILAKHGIADNTYRKYMAQVDTTTPSAIPTVEVPEISLTVLAQKDIETACCFFVRRAMDFVSQDKITIRDVEAGQRVVLMAKECIYGKDNPTLAIKTTEQQPECEANAADISISPGANPASIKMLSDLYGLANKNSMN